MTIAKLNPYQDVITEKFLEDIFVNAPWAIERGFEILERQKRTKAGIIDIFGKDISGNYVVVELKKNRPDDRVIGQTARYMGAIKEKLDLSVDQVRGIIFCKKISNKLAFASKIIPNLVIIEYGDFNTNPNNLRHWELCANCIQNLISETSRKSSKNSLKNEPRFRFWEELKASAKNKQSI